jgi:hypothetical protein
MEDRSMKSVESARKGRGRLSDAARHRLPNRRPSDSLVFEFGGAEYLMTLGFDPETSDVREVFLNVGKTGSALDNLLADVALVVSVALQHGVSLDALRLSMARAGGFDVKCLTSTSLGQNRRFS